MTDTISAPQTCTTPTTIKETRPMNTGDLLFLTATVSAMMADLWATNTGGGS